MEMIQFTNLQIQIDQCCAENYFNKEINLVIPELSVFKQNSVQIQKEKKKNLF